ncbi:MAG: CotH kinase family protein [Bacteroidota bacterium]
MERRTPIIFILLLSLIAADSYSQLLLNEMMSYNFTILEDQFGEHPDWIEIYNPGDEDVELGNYWLSDNIEELNKWNLPHVDLPGGGYFVAFASGRGLQSDPSYWHTIINVGDQWRYMVPEAEIDDSWKSSSAATTDWSVGKSGIGYNDGDDSTLIGQTISLYMQKTFNISDLSEVTHAALFMDYDDGFIAYLNGSEIARSASMGDSGVAFGFDQPSLTGHEAVMYNGDPPDSFYLSNHLDLLQEGENVLAIEVHNAGATSSDMTSIPFFLLGFSQIREDLTLGNPYIVVMNVYPHTNFKIASEGEAIYLSDGAGLIIDSISMISLPPDRSYGRLPSDQTQFGYFDQPTPGSENSTSVSSGYFMDSVEFLITGEESDSTSLQMVTRDANDTIYFTSDGSEPDSGSEVYTGELDITTTQVIRARILRSGYLPGTVTTRTFFKGRKHDITRVSVATDPANLFDYHTGIYEMGPNAAPDWPYYGANFWQDWEKPVYLDISDAHGQQLIGQNAGIKIYGGSTRCLALKPFAFYARSAYGKGSFSYPLFPEKNIEKFETFILRNNGGDYTNGMFRDAISGYLAGKLNVDHQGYRPSVLYLNGEYWGIMNIREKLNEHFVASNHHVHTEDVNIFQDNASLMSGSRTSWDKLISFATTHNLQYENNYNTVKGMMDVDNYIRYWLLEVYLDNWDWPQHNIKFWNTQAPGSLFRWILYDTDFGYDLPNQRTYTFNTLKFSMGIESEHPWINAEWSTELFNSLIVNAGFRNSFINQMADRMNSDFLPENIVPVVYNFRRRISSEAPYHFEKWGGSVTNWNNHLALIQNFLNNRSHYMRGFIIEQFNLTTTSDITVYVSDPDGGSIRVNSIVPEAYPFQGIYFTDVPIQLEAIPAPGYRFSRWEGSVTSVSKTIDFDMHTTGTFTALFEEVPDAEVDVVINEINYYADPERDTDDWIELYNNSEVAVDLSAWRLSDGSSGVYYTIQPGTTIPQNGYMVMGRSRADFRRIFPERQPLLGDFDFGLSRNGDAVALFDESGGLHDFVRFESEPPWPTGPNGSGATLELINPDLDNTLPESWRASSTNGTPCIVNSQFVGIGDGILNRQITSSASIYPTLFHDMTTIEYRSSASDHVHISVISMSGKVIDVLKNHTLPAGNHRMNWTPAESGAKPGLYLIRIETSETIHTLKAIYQ